MQKKPTTVFSQWWTPLVGHIFAQIFATVIGMHDGSALTFEIIFCFQAVSVLSLPKQTWFLTCSIYRKVLDNVLSAVT